MGAIMYFGVNLPVDPAGMEKNDCKNYKGSFGVTKRGTIFLGESGKIDEINQVSLLRLRKTKKYQRIGDTRDIKAGLRVVMATKEKLNGADCQGRFGVLNRWFQ
jgi:DNA-binding NtrC family response regulator